MRRPALITVAVLSASIAFAGVAHGSGLKPDVSDSPYAKAFERLGDSDRSPSATVTSAGSVPVGNNTMRVFGLDRYETAVELSKASWGVDSAAYVYLATGESFPDALAMGASDFDLGPILLTKKATLPAVVAAELARLDPCYIIAVGGPGVITDDVLRAADAYTKPAGCTTTP